MFSDETILDRQTDRQTDAYKSVFLSLDDFCDNRTVRRKAYMPLRLGGLFVCRKDRVKAPSRYG